MSSTIFSRIVRGEVPCHRVYEDDRVLAFLDIAPLSLGHTLVIPKEEAPTLDRLSEESAAAIGRVLPRICGAILQATGARAFNVLQNNGPGAHQAVMHVHFHIIPRFGPDEPGSAHGRGLELGWSPRSLGADTGRELAARIAALLRR